MEKCYLCDQKKEKERMVQASVNGITKVSICTSHEVADYGGVIHITSFEVMPREHRSNCGGCQGCE